MYNFEQKNEIILRISGTEYFGKDKELFLKNCSNPKLERDLKKANQFTFADIDARMISELLNSVTEETILINRKEAVQTLIQEKPEVESQTKIQTENPQASITPENEEPNLIPDKKKGVNKKNLKK